MKRIKFSLLAVLFLFTSLLFGCELLAPVAEDTSSFTEVGSVVSESEALTVIEGEPYLTMEEVAEYVHLYKELPPNYLTKDEAEELGWNPQAGNLWEVAEGRAIGGNRFGNREGLLPQAPGRQYYEADVNYTGGHRNAERIVFSNDGLIFYTDDHYETFEQLYGEGAE